MDDAGAIDADDQVGRLEDGQAGHVARRPSEKAAVTCEPDFVGRLGQHGLSRRHVEPLQNGAAGRVGGAAGGDPAAQDAVLAGADVEALAALVGDGGRRLEEDEAVFGMEAVGTAGELIARQDGEVEIGILAAERELETVLAVLVAVAGALIAAAARQHGHDLVAEADRAVGAAAEVRKVSAARQAKQRAAGCMSGLAAGWVEAHPFYAGSVDGATGGKWGSFLWPRMGVRRRTPSSRLSSPRIGPHSEGPCQSLFPPVN